MPNANVDAAEVAKFEAMAADWWDPAGKFRPLHQMNPCRLDYVVAQIAAEFGRDTSAARPFDGLAMLDVGCGGGLLSEPMARLGAAVTGIDASPGSAEVAAAHAAQSGLEIEYRTATAESLADEARRFDVVLAMEVIEHVADPRALLATCRALLKPGGLLLVSTLNRTPRSFAAAIVGAEWLLRWLPRGTHDWRRFLTPEETWSALQAAGLDPVDRKGFVYDPFSGRWSVSDRDLSVNYVVAALAPDAA
ncbi:bifunctional 2-polyprenyl-6-hydroxyphenol methylase/3-demethylubiquinol 3-O-methyltransferase UbiG [Roseivivax sp. CAU 1761]